MIVARQFIAWYPSENGNRPYGTDSRLNGFQAINCLATII
jgi:hypothetical protein